MNPTRHRRGSQVRLGGVMLALLAGATRAAGGEGWSGEGAAEYLRAGDMELATGLVAVRWEGEPGRADLKVEQRRTFLEYAPNAPIDPLGAARSRREHGLGLQGAGRWNVTPAHQALLQAGWFRGWREPNAIWLDEYYRQQWEGSTIPGTSYRRPAPEGWSGSVGWRWAYQPAGGFLQAQVLRQRESVAPGYEAEFAPDTGRVALRQGPQVLQTWLGNVSWEAVLSPRARWQHQISLGRTTARSTRLGWQGTWLQAWGEHWATRLPVAAGREGGAFSYWSAGLTLDREINETHRLSLTFRHYADTGQIETADLVTNAAPALQTRQWLLGWHWLSPDQTRAWSVSAGPYRTRYEALGRGSERFANLYRDRSWWAVQVAGHWNF